MMQAQDVRCIVEFPGCAYIHDFIKMSNLKRQKMPGRMLVLLLLFVSLDVSAAGTEDTHPPVAAPAPGSIDSVTINQNSEDKAACAEKLDRYRKSLDCFAPYTNTNGTMKPGAFDHCTTVKYPIECPLN